jgi:hypothetical protein
MLNNIACFDVSTQVSHIKDRFENTLVHTLVATMYFRVNFAAEVQVARSNVEVSAPFWLKWGIKRLSFIDDT